MVSHDTLNVKCDPQHMNLPVDMCIHDVYCDAIEFASVVDIVICDACQPASDTDVSPE